MTQTLPFPAITVGPTTGPVVLLLHGFPQTKSAWRDVLPVLGDAGYRAVAFDQRGYRPPSADREPGGFALQALAADVLTMAEALNAERFHVVGHDWGGAVTWQLAADAHERLITATVVATPHPRALVRSAIGTQAVRSLYVAAFNLPFLPELALRSADGYLLRTLLVRSGLDTEHAAEYTAAMLANGVLSRALGWYRANRLRGIASVGPARAPTLYVWPSGDVALGRRAAERTADHVEATYRFEVLHGCPHWVPERRPVELSSLVLEHLASATVANATGTRIG